MHKHTRTRTHTHTAPVSAPVHSVRLPSLLLASLQATVSVCNPHFYAQRFVDFMMNTVFKKGKGTCPVNHPAGSRLCVLCTLASIARHVHCVCVQELTLLNEMFLIQCVLHTSPSSFEEQQVSSLILSCPEMRGSCLYRRVPCTVPCTYVHACRVLSLNLQYRMSHYEGPMATRMPHACPSVVTPCIGMLVSHYTYVHIPMDIRTYVHT